MTLGLEEHPDGSGEERLLQEEKKRISIQEEEEEGLTVVATETGRSKSNGRHCEERRGEDQVNVTFKWEENIVGLRRHPHKLLNSVGVL